MRKMKKAILSGIAATFLATGTAHATADGCAVVLRTPDGFLNVRSAPTMKARIIAQTKPGDILYIDDVGGGEGWTHVTGVHRLDAPLWTPKSAHYTKGWVPSDPVRSAADQRPFLPRPVASPGHPPSRAPSCLNRLSNSARIRTAVI